MSVYLELALATVLIVFAMIALGLCIWSGADRG